MHLSMCMRNLKLNVRTTIFLILFLDFIILFYGEVICYYLDRLYWSDLQCESKNESCTRILLVADPQIIGDNDGPAIRSWDSDRYLYFSYQHALSHFKPDIIIFLGDLMDEGSTSTFKQYSRYLKRFHNMFLGYPAEFIYIPGDNDIGGEFGDWISPSKIFRFEQILSRNQSKQIDYSETITFYKINHLVQQYEYKIDLDEYKIRIGLSHLPLTQNDYGIIRVEKMGLDIIFSGHNHLPLIIKSNTKAGTKDFTHVDLNVNKIYKADLKQNEVVEFVVPTCSYRMGVPNMGYGAAVLDAEKTRLNYTIFWLHSRFKLLWLYFCALSISIILLIPLLGFQFCYLCSKKRFKFQEKRLI